MPLPERAFDRGELYMGFMDPVFGREIGGYKYRPCLVVSIPDFNSSGLVTIVPGTRTPQKEESWNCVRVENTRSNGLDDVTYFLCHQVRAVEQARLARRIGTVSQEDLLRIRAVLGRGLGIP